MKCPICNTELDLDNHNRCGRFPVCSFIGKQQQMNLSEEPYIVFDIETTGFGDKHRITEIAAIKVVNNKIIDTFEELSNPGKDEDGNPILISARVASLTGITNEMVAKKPVESEVVKKFISWLGDIQIACGQNVKEFDIPFVKAAARRAGVSFNVTHCVDTLICAKRLKLKENGYISNYKQETLARYYGFTYHAHRALDDTEACFKILNCLSDESRRMGIEMYPEEIKRK